MLAALRQSWGRVMTVKNALLAVDSEVHRITESKNSVLSGLVINLIREVRQELRMQDNSARKDMSIVDSVYRSME